MKNIITDEASIFIDSKHKIKFIKGEKQNIKITYKDDLKKPQTFFGIGFDIHTLKKTGAFYNFSIRLNQDDIREYSFTDLARAEYMRRVMIGHLEEKIKKESKAL